MADYRDRLKSHHKGGDGITPGTAARTLYDRRSSSGQLMQPWLVKQEKVFTAWCNEKLHSSWARQQRELEEAKAGAAGGAAAPGEPIKILDLFEDFRDGIKLYALLETLSGENLRVLGKLANVEHVVVAQELAIKAEQQLA